MAKHGKLYENSPKLERDEDGEVSVKKKASPGEDGSNAEDGGEVKNEDPHEAERKAMHKRHEEEQSSMHERHRKDLKEMHKRHEGSKEKEKTGEGQIEKIENKE